MWGGGNSRTVVAGTVGLGVMMLAGALGSVAAPGGTAARVLPSAVRAARCSGVAATVPPAATTLPGHVEGFAVGDHAALAYVPGAYATHPEARFPVVYFLHGAPGSAEDWMATAPTLPALLDGLIGGGRLAPMLAVFPDGRASGSDGSWWADTAAGGPVESWLVQQLVPAIDARYRTLGARHRGIAGVSAGGLGALNLSLHHPGMFSWVASYSGVFTAPDDVFGASAAADSPQLTVASLPAGERTPLFLGGGADDTEFLPQTTRFIDTVRSLGWAPLQTAIVPGPHGWEAWQTEAQSSLVWLGRLWGTNLADAPVAAAGSPARTACRT
jgi:enterochelin esterase-like enzyme